MRAIIWSMNRPVCIRHIIIVRYNNNMYIELYYARASVKTGPGRGKRTRTNDVQRDGGEQKIKQTTTTKWKKRKKLSVINKTKGSLASVADRTRTRFYLAIIFASDVLSSAAVAVCRIYYARTYSGAHTRTRANNLRANKSAYIRCEAAASLRARAAAAKSVRRAHALLRTIINPSDSRDSRSDSARRHAHAHERKSVSALIRTHRRQCTCTCTVHSAVTT